MKNWLLKLKIIIKLVLRVKEKWEVKNTEEEKSFSRQWWIIKIKVFDKNWSIIFKI